MSLKRGDDEYCPVPAKKPRKASVKPNSIAAKIKYATEDEAKEMLTTLLNTHPEVMEVTLQDFQPRRMPVKPPVDDELFSMCFHCNSSETEGGPALTKLHSSSDIKVCEYCRGSMFKKQGETTLTRDKVQSYFHFTKAEAAAIPFTTSTGGFYKSKIYVYSLGSVVTAVNKKYGSLYLMAKNNRGA